MAIKSKARHDLTLRSIKREIARQDAMWPIGWTRLTVIWTVVC